MVICPVDHRHLDRGALEYASRIQPAKAAADYHHSRPAGRCHDSGTGGDLLPPPMLRSIPTTTTVTAPTTLCQRKDTRGAPKFTVATAAMPAISPANAPRPFAFGIIASRKTPRMDP